MLRRNRNKSDSQVEGIFISEVNGKTYSFMYEGGDFRLVPPVHDQRIECEFEKEIEDLPGDECELWFDDTPADFRWEQKPDVLYFHGYVGDFLKTEVEGFYDIGRGEVRFQLVDGPLACRNDLLRYFLEDEMKAMYEEDCGEIEITNVEPENGDDFSFRGKLGKKAPLEFEGVYDGLLEYISDLREPDESKHVFAIDYREEILEAVQAAIRNRLF